MSHKWKDRLLGGNRDCLVSYLNESCVIYDYEISEFFKFLSGMVKLYPDTIEIVIQRILEEWNTKKHALLFKSTASFLAKLKKTVRKQEFKTQISKLWPLIFGFPGQERLKLFLVQEYRKELPFNWLFEYVMQDDTVLLYSVNLNADELDRAAMAVIDILLELLEKTKRSDPEEGLMEELRMSGLLEKIGSLWRTPSFRNGSILKLLALASSISGASNNIFDSLPGLLDSVLGKMGNIWMFRLVDTIIRRYPKRQYVLSQSRAELSQVSIQIVQICTKSLDYVFKDVEYNKTVTGLVKSVLERWEDLTDCPPEIELEFCEKVQWFLDESYKQIQVQELGQGQGQVNCDHQEQNHLMQNKEHQQFGFNLLYALVKEFIDDFVQFLVLFFRNALKYSVIDSSRTDCLSLIVKQLVKDGGTDRSFCYLFKEYPSLISDIYTLINEIDESNCNYLWLLILMESPRTQKVLIDYIIDPEQIQRVKCDEFWIEFMGRLIDVDPNNKRWKSLTSNYSFCDEFLLRARRSNSEYSHYFLVLLKRVIEEYNFNDPENVKFILKCSKHNFEILNLLILNNNHKVDIILNHLVDLVPFGSGEIAKKVFNSVKGQLKSPLELVNKIFSGDLNALAQWNLLIESGNLNFKPDRSNEINILPKDYGTYLENLYSELTKEPNVNLIKESDDLIEMYLEYYKYGQIRSMQLMQITLLNRHRFSELLVRIPLTILRDSGKGFSTIVLDDLLVNGWTEADLAFIDSAKVDCLIHYYQSRLI